MSHIFYKAKTTQKEKSEFNNIWVHGDLIISDKKYYIHPHGNKVNVNGEIGDKIVMHEVIPETLCMNTGIKDVNGNDIYENDIVEVTHSKVKRFTDDYLFPFPKTEEYKRNYAIEFINSYYNYGYRCIKRSIHFMIKRGTVIGHDIKVIGNIFDDPDLLKQ